jgi:hypothetical protein
MIPRIMGVWFTLRFFVPGHFRQQANPVASQTAMQGGPRQERDRGLQGVEGEVRSQRRALGSTEPSSGYKVCRRKATMMASSSIDNVVDLATLGPMGRSMTDVRRFHLAPVFGLML